MSAGPGRDPVRREQLLDAADRAIAAHGPGVRMEDVAAEAGVTKPIVYRHFGDKGGLYEALARRYADRLLDALTAAMASVDDPREKLRTTIDTFLTAIEERPELYRFLLQRAAAERPEVSQAVGDFTYQLAEHVAQIVTEEFHRFGLRIGQPLVIAHAVIGMVHQVSDWWLSAGDADRTQLRDLLVRLFWNGLPTVATGDRDLATAQWRAQR